MTLNEFKAWLDGFEAAMADAPTAEQWATITAKLKTVTLASPPTPRDGDPWKRYFGGGQVGALVAGHLKDDPFKDLSGE